jgi:ubiquinone/menaquinone biosynthesis C-methylase UbiE
MEKLLSFIPERKGRILDVACGKGATTAYLLKDFAAENVFGSNISEKQLETARKRAPEATFLLMDAVQLDFEDNYFDHIICVEAVFHFETREKFLEEALRVLRPGGFLVLSDILLTDWGRQHILWGIAESNGDLRAEHYRDLCLDKGFSEALVEDVTRQSWECHCKSVARFSEEKLLAGQMNVKMYETVASRIFRMIPHIETYALLAARKG